MLQKTKALVISNLKYGDNSLIVRCYTQKYGIKSYLIKGILGTKKGKLKRAFFQPLTQLAIVARHNNKGFLNSIQEAHITQHYQELQTDIVKQSIAVFLSEILHICLREEEPNTALYQFLETAFNWLDTHDRVANFHLLFLLRFTKYLGFYPGKALNQPYFDLREGKFVTQPVSEYFIQHPQIDHFKLLLGTDFDALPHIPFNGTKRRQMLELLIRYIGLHLHPFKTPKSLSVLHTLFE